MKLATILTATSAFLGAALAQDAYSPSTTSYLRKQKFAVHFASAKDTSAFADASLAKKKKKKTTNLGMTATIHNLSGPVDAPHLAPTIDEALVRAWNEVHSDELDRALSFYESHIDTSPEDDNDNGDAAEASTSLERRKRRKNSDRTKVTMYGNLIMQSYYSNTLYDESSASLFVGRGASHHATNIPALESALCDLLLSTGEAAFEHVSRCSIMMSHHQDENVSTNVAL
jgi:hypothetical protein